MLNDVRGKIIVNNDENSQIVEKIDSLYKYWNNMYKKMAYYIEHDELEKIELYITALKSNVETEEYGQAVEKIDSCIFILKHIEAKYSFNLQNIF